jgi:hypothetical protein
MDGAADEVADVDEEEQEMLSEQPPDGESMHRAHCRGFLTAQPRHPTPGM